ncbi:hypothetical protein KPL76_09290 [Subtercola sp. PAMC28395]|uniref:hypothetical protein n=1 Tax=Subtercola sp. PAMC28395 TaxID=2846775 RepID=UPI001C0CE228|nr:hypothetical protein [Subtercola sp. PAMC28395]QWT22973.1 hypothetical protein KPL76_09290 [Subtercola sp. PAMC28395]
MKHPFRPAVTVWAIVAVVAVAAGVSGCSQVAALAPVGGNTITEIRYAANDVLVSAGIDILTAPVCASTAGGVTCSGQTASGEPIAVTTTDAALTTIDVTVGSKTVYSGSVSDVLDAAARATK